ncbi:MAG: excinuclease ATPase subunit [Oligoflexales bacterium]
MKVTTCFLITISLLCSGSAWAADNLFKFPVKDVLARPEAQRLSDVKFYFGDTKHPEAETKFGQDETNKKTNAFNKTERTACEWVMLSALQQLYKKAKSLGANAVVNIKSNFKGIEYKSETEYECGVGALMAGVALKADFIYVKSK